MNEISNDYRPMDVLENKIVRFIEDFIILIEPNEESRRFYFVILYSM